MALLYPDDPGSEGPLSVPALRKAALGLCALYLPCFRGDAHFREIAKDYGGIGTTCGYLPAWMLWRLGCRDPRIVNRSEPQAGLTYRIGMNIADLVQGGKAVGCFRLYHPGGPPPEPGDILYFQSATFADGGGGEPKEHVAVLKAWPAGGTGDLVTYDLGHSLQPEGSESTRHMANGVVNFMGSQKRLVGIDNLALIPFTAAPDLTDHTLGGVG